LRFFAFDTDLNGHPIDNGKPTSALRPVNSERHWNCTVQCAFLVSR